MSFQTVARWEASVDQKMLKDKKQQVKHPLLGAAYQHSPMQ
jgi:hypothetical protein